MRLDAAVRVSGSQPAHARWSQRRRRV